MWSGVQLVGSFDRLSGAGRGRLDHSAVNDGFTPIRLIERNWKGSGRRW